MQYDSRKLTLEQKEFLRKRAVLMVVEDCKKQVEVAQILKISTKSVYLWVKSYKKSGIASLGNKIHGRPRHTIAKLKPYQCSVIVRTITDKTPDQMKFPFMLWNRKSVQYLIMKKFNVTLSLATVGRYLKKWGFTPQRPLSKSFEKNPKAVTKFLQEEFPAIKQRAKEEKAEIQFLDEMGLKNNIHHYIRGYSKKGITPIISKTGKRLSINMISTISNNGSMRFMTYKGKMEKDRLIEFFKKLIKINQSKKNKRKIFLILN